LFVRIRGLVEKRLLNFHPAILVFMLSGANWKSSGMLQIACELACVVLVLHGDGGGAGQKFERRAA
jgi:hypothetical protein